MVLRSKHIIIIAIVEVNTIEAVPNLPSFRLFPCPHTGQILQSSSISAPQISQTISTVSSPSFISNIFYSIL